jgi:hypothetical protein
VPLRCSFGRVELWRRNRGKSATRALTTSDTASSRWLLRFDRLTQALECAQNRRCYPAAEAVAGAVPLRCSFGRGRAVATKSRQSAISVHYTSDAASSRWLLRSGCTIQTPGRAPNRRRYPAAKAVAGAVPLRRVSRSRPCARSRWTGSEPWAVLLGKRLQGRDDLRSTAVGRRIIARFARLQSTAAAGEEGACAGQPHAKAPVRRLSAEP